MFCVFLARHFFATIGNKQQPPEKIKIWCRWRMFHKMGRNPAGYRALLSLSRFTSDQELRHFFFLSCWLYESLGWRSSSVSHPSWWCGRKNLFIFIFSFLFKPFLFWVKWFDYSSTNSPPQKTTQETTICYQVFLKFIWIVSNTTKQSREKRVFFFFVSLVIIFFFWHWPCVQTQLRYGMKSHDLAKKAGIAIPSCGTRPVSPSTRNTPRIG